MIHEPSPWLPRVDKGAINDCLTQSLYIPGCNRLRIG